MPRTVTQPGTRTIRSLAITSSVASAKLAEYLPPQKQNFNGMLALLPTDSEIIPGRLPLSGRVLLNWLPQSGKALLSWVPQPSSLRFLKLANHKGSGMPGP